jgi:hypothetical protein
MSLGWEERPSCRRWNGKAELVVQDAASYQRLFDLAERLETIPLSN